MALQFGFGAMLLPTILSPFARVPRSSSVPTAIGLWIMTGTFYAMGSLWLASLGTAICALGWTIVAVLRPLRHTQGLIRWGE